MTVTAATASDSLSVCTSILYLLYYPTLVVPVFYRLCFVWFATINCAPGPFLMVEFG